MRREDFLYQYLLKYNEYEKDFNRENAVEYWKNHDKDYGTSGLVFMVLRNALVHNTLETIVTLEKVNSFSEIIESLEKCKLQSEEQTKYMNIFFENNKIIKDLKNKGFDLIDTHRKDIFKLFQRKDKEMNSSIFFSHANLLYETSVSTYNHQTNSKEYYNGYYIETELQENNYLIKFFKNDVSVIMHNVNIYVDKNFNPKRLYQSIDSINISIITYGTNQNTEIKLNSEDINKLGNNGIKEIFDTYACDSTVREVSRKTKDSYKSLNNFLHTIGIQNNV